MPAKNASPEKLSKEVREAIVSAFDALSEWRDEMAAANERYSEKVFDQMASATRSMGLPDDAINSTREQMQAASQMQLHMMDKMMDAWSEQIKSPNGQVSIPSDFLQQMQAFQRSASPNPFANMSNLGAMPVAPFQFWMQAAEMWQKNMAMAMSVWSNAANGAGHDTRDKH